jgi:undecaprenyl-diphosphatase
MSLLAATATITTAVICTGLVVTHLGPLDRWDDHVNEWLAQRRTPAWTTISYWGTYIANTLGVVVVAAVATVILLLRRIGRMAALLVTGLTVEIICFLVANHVVGRPRPTVAHLGSTPSTFSFPSGHAAATLVLYGGIAVIVYQRTRNALVRVVVLVIAAGLPAWVAFSRVYRGQHHPTDVIAGLLMGGAVLIAATSVLRNSPRVAKEAST